MAPDETAADRSEGADRRVARSVTIEADVARVFAQWTHYEALPRMMGGVRRTQRIDEGRILWDVDVAGRQAVWEAEIVEVVPSKRIRWRSRWGTPNAGSVSFEQIDDGRTRVSVEMRYRPQGLIERIGAALGFVGRRLARDLRQFKRALERAPAVAVHPPAG